MIGTVTHVAPEVAQQRVKEAQEAPSVDRSKVTLGPISESPPPLETNLSGKPFYVNMQGQKTGTVINDQA
jgi:hypothetical protein